MEVREVYGGTFRAGRKLGPGESYRINYDLNATYRKYMIVGPDDFVQVLASDDIIENQLIKVVDIFDEKGIWGWNLEFTQRAGSKPNNGQEHHSHGHHLLSKWNKLLGR